MKKKLREIEKLRKSNEKIFKQLKRIYTFLSIHDYSIIVTHIIPTNIKA
ncbi:hypothetical protein NXY29_00475 [Bacteroides fragilis]|nr:hypothetical protein [Bacteroides fragilis]